MDITQLRTEINQIDSEFCQLFVRRMAVSAEIARYKKTHGLPILNSTREAEILQKVSDLVGEELSPYARTLYQTLMDLSKNYQKDILDRQ